MDVSLGMFMIHVLQWCTCQRIRIAQRTHDESHSPRFPRNSPARYGNS
ncbi:hypothetical protein M271_24795 [Streptomyces rapamycinicus NRRL 5491]|uniref:Uncharacterized protein n=1 Tax=Streptomyces iranensis TaxID=576784 RepID=A0A060ZQD9_9ACTN|nr:hypothetical protein M271_24795 [Streptomyces rapamycinicus NRRL 5491]CDR08330.1 predicted protein [Streptomyces iranensis]